MWWKLLIIGVLISCALFVLGYYIGTWYAAEYKMYRSKVNHLDFTVRHAIPEKIYYLSICEMFHEIKKFDCGNVNDLTQIEELENIFKEKFKDFISINEKEKR